MKSFLRWLFNIPEHTPLAVGQTWLGEKALCPFPEAMDEEGQQTIGFWTATIVELKGGWVRSTLAWPKGKMDAKTEADFRTLYPYLKKP